MRNPILAAVVGVSVLLLVSASSALAQQSSGQQKCLNGINKDGAGVAKTQGKENLGCQKAKGQGKLVGSAQACLTADSKGKVQKAKDKTTANVTKNCGAPPTFGFTSASTVNNAAVQGQLDLENDIFGNDLDAATSSCSTNKPSCLCQQKVYKGVEKLVDTKLATFVNCKKAALKAGANSAQALRDCVNNAGTEGSIAADTKGKIQKGVDKLNATIVKSCTTPAVTLGAFPGACNAFDDGQLGTCLDTHIECRVCQIINEMDGIFVNCDLFDNGTPDMSCASGAVATPTPTPTLTPTKTPTPTCTPVSGHAVLKGTLPATAGRFNYNLTLGLPGADSACNMNFPGSHACELTELQAAPTSDLACLKDPANFTVSSFWAINRSNTMDVANQCYDDATFSCSPMCTVPGHNWEYGTAHTASRGRKVPLNNGTGVLGMLGSPEQCNFSTSWVGCCQ